MKRKRGGALRVVRYLIGAASLDGIAGAACSLAGRPVAAVLVWLVGVGMLLAAIVLLVGIVLSQLKEGT